MVHLSSSAYLSSYLYRQPLPESRKLQNLPRTTLGSQNLSLERRNGPNPSDRCIGKLAYAQETTTEDKCNGRWVYLWSYLYRQPLPEPQKLHNLFRSSTSGNQNLLLERRNGPNPSARCIRKPMCAHETATEDKCDSSWEYLSIYLYHQPPRISKLGFYRAI